MSEMVERAAREMEIAWVERTGHHPVGSMHETIKYLFPVMARAVIEALREPTEGMLEAGDRGMAGAGHDASEFAWPAMIDAALKSNAEVG